jgi:DNA-binding LacI/PurR family transcriptional regulator
MGAENSTREPVCDRSQPVSDSTETPVRDRSRSASIRDVARAAGVSYQTVSRVINESPNVSGTTRTAVLAAISELKFRPNRAARALAGGPLQGVTVLATNTSLYGYAAAIEGIEEATREVGFAMGFRTLKGVEPEEMREAVERAIEPASGLIVIAFDRAGALALESVPADVPTAAMIQAPRSGSESPPSSVWIDEFAAAKEATQYLLNLGHRTVHHVPIPDWSGATPRLEGWKSALQEAGVEAPPVPKGGWTAEWGYEAGATLAKKPNVTAVLCGNDELALGLMRAMHESGRRIPSDVSVIGFDDVPYAKFSFPALTTVRQDFKTLGKVCFARLLELAEAGVVIGRATAPQAELVVRETAGPPPAEQEDLAARSPPGAL